MRISGPFSSFNRRRKFLSRVFCKTTGRNHTSLSLFDCRFLPESDPRRIGKSRPVDTPDVDYEEATEVHVEENALID